MSVHPRGNGHRPARKIVAVASGKGGVGKSTVSLNVALALTELGERVGLLDADVYGPDIPVMVGLTRTQPLDRWPMWRRHARPLEPVERFGLQIMSVGFLLGERQTFPWAEQTLPYAIRQLVYQVGWRDLDVLVIDLPPGTADLQEHLVRDVELTGAVVVVTPQDVAHLDAKKVVTLLNEAGVPILGGIENMSGLVCPHCGEGVEIFPPVRTERSIWSLGVPLLGRIPLDPATAEAGDRGAPVVGAGRDTAQAQAFRAAAEALATALESS